MTPRRIALVTGLAGLILSAARPAASDPVTVEGTTYGGTASGGWACGPNEQAKYGGIGAKVTIRPTRLRTSHDGEADPAPREEAPTHEEATTHEEAPAREEAPTHEEATTREEEPAADTGLVVSLAGAGEHRSFSLATPRPGNAYASALEVGYDTKWFGFRVGGLAYENWWNQSDTTPSWSLFPQTQLRFGPMDGLVSMELGLGSYGASTMLRPGCWVGFLDVPHPGWEIALRAGPVATTGVAESGGWRGDLGVKIPVVADALQLGLGGSLSTGIPGEVDPEGRLTLIAHLR